MIGWPSHFDPWGEPFEAARREIAGLANAILSTAPANGMASTRVTLVLDGDEAERVARAAVPDAFIINTACGDTWIRDTGPILARNGRQLVANTFRFNGWGEKYIYPGDADLSGRLASQLEASVISHEFVLEGGSVDWDGAGHLLTTDECLINPNRNKGWTRDTAEMALENAFGVENIIWIAQGLLNDHTDGHIDNLARFVGPGKVVCQAPNGSDDPHAERLLAIEETLRSYRNRNGEALEVITLPSPGRVLDEDGDVMPASHMNFVITNQAIVIPAYNDHVADAAGVMSGLFPDRAVLTRPARSILTGGGAFHCISQQIPSAVGG